MNPPKAREMTVDEYSELMNKWQEAYYTWNASCVHAYNMTLMNTLMQQMPMLNGGNLLAMSVEVNPRTAFDPLTEIRNARLKIASIWRRFLAEIIDFVLLHVLKILVIFFLANYFHLIDTNRSTVNYMLSSFLYEDTLSFPMELICVELGYLIASVSFETYCLVRYGATPGKRLLRLRVVKCEPIIQIQENDELNNESVTILSIGGALTRSTFKMLMSTFLLPAVIIALLSTQNRQTSYDIAASSVVVELEH